MPSPSPPPSVGRRASGRRVPGTVRCADGAEESVFKTKGGGVAPGVDRRVGLRKGSDRHAQPGHGSGRSGVQKTLGAESKILGGTPPSGSFSGHK